MNLYNKIRILILRLKGIEIENSSIIQSNVYLEQIGNGKIRIGNNCELSQGVIFKTYGGKIELKENTFIGEYVVIYGHGGVNIGANTLIAMHTCIVSSNHTMPIKRELIRDHPDLLLPVSIGTDVWIGANCSILGGLNIGNGAVVGAGSVVTQDLPEYAVAVGNPAKIIRYRNA